MTDLKSLIAKLETAKKGSRELDWDITIIIEFPRNGSAPPYTTSLDAALTLVPEGCYETILSWNSMKSEFGYCRMNVRGPFGKHGWHEDRIGEGKTPALAICIAALKAREND